MIFLIFDKICSFSRENKILGKIIKYFDFFCSFTKFFFYFDNYFEKISLNIGIPWIETLVPIGTEKNFAINNICFELNSKIFKDNL